MQDEEEGGMMIMKVVYIWDWPAKSPAFPGDRNVSWRASDLPGGHMTLHPAYGGSAEKSKASMTRQLLADGYVVMDLGSLDVRDDALVDERIRECTR